VTARVVVAAMGNEYRRDDGVGAAVVAAVAPLLDELRAPGFDTAGVGPFGDPLDLLGPWDHATLAVVVDAVRTGAAPGTVVVVDLGGPGGSEAVDRRASSTHGLGVAGALRLARAVGRAPDRVVAVGIEGGDFGNGTGLSEAVDRAVGEAAARVLDLVRSVRPCA